MFPISRSNSFNLNWAATKVNRRCCECLYIHTYIPIIHVSINLSRNASKSICSEPGTQAQWRMFGPRRPSARCWWSRSWRFGVAIGSCVWIFSGFHLGSSSVAIAGWFLLEHLEAMIWGPWRLGHFHILPAKGGYQAFVWFQTVETRYSFFGRIPNDWVLDCAWYFRE